MKWSVSNGLFITATTLFFIFWWTFDIISFAWFIILTTISLPITREIADLLIKKFKLGYRVSGGNGAYAVITGASRGIGKAIALQLVKDGFNVYAGVRKEADGQALEAEASKISSSSTSATSNTSSSTSPSSSSSSTTPGTLRYVILDVVNQESIDEAVRIVSKAVGDEGVSILVNNAGVAMGTPGSQMVPLEVLSMEAYSGVIDVNYLGPVRVTKAFLPLLRKAASRGGWTSRIVNVSSVAGLGSSPLLAAYAASKFALEAWSQGLSMEVEEHGVDVVMINPGAIRTDMLGKVESFDEKKFQEDLASANLELYSKHAAYGHFFADMGKTSAIPAEDVGELTSFIAHVHSRDVRTRYLIGKNAGIYAVLVMLPERFMSNFMLPVIRRSFGAK